MESDRPAELTARIRAAVREARASDALEALDLLAGYADQSNRDDVLALHGRYAALERRQDSGTLTTEEHGVLLARLTQTTLSIAERISKRHSGSPVALPSLAAGPSVFLSHVTEDHDLVVGPLAKAAVAAGFDPWVDREQIGVGASIVKAVSGGVTSCTAAVLVLSPAYLASGWTVLEANTLINLEASSGKPRLLPVRHDHLSASAVADSFPLLRDKLSLTTDDGVPTVVTAVIRALAVPEGSRG